MHCHKHFILLLCLNNYIFSEGVEIFSNNDIVYQRELSNVASKILNEFTSKKTSNIALIRHSQKIENIYIHDAIIQQILFDSQGVITVHQMTGRKGKDTTEEKKYLDYRHNLIVIDSVESFR